MASVDFSQAVIEVDETAGGSSNSVLQANYLNFDNGWGLWNSSNNQISTGHITTKLGETATKVSFAHEGTFTDSGTEFYIRSGWSDNRWKVSNISFQSGDTYSFQIDLEMTVS